MTDKLDKHLDGVDEERRAALKKMVRTAAFVAPVVSTFAVDGKALAATSGSNTVSS